MNVEEYGGSYRRLFMEKTFQDKIENFVPNQSDYEEVDALIELVKHDIIRARFDQLLPPVPQVKLDISKGRVYTLIFFSFRVVLGIFILLFIKTVSLAGVVWRRCHIAPVCPPVPPQARVRFSARLTFFFWKIFF